MLLIIEPELKAIEGNLTNCTEKLDITAKQDNTNEIELDVAELKIHSVSWSKDLCRDENKEYSDKKNGHNERELFFITQTKKEKLVIKLEKTLSKGDSICITIKYSAGIYGDDFTLGRIPRSGFHFIQPDKYYPEKNLQAWTQGETIESRYWFPCLDDPQVKFAREIHIRVPRDYMVISNGDLVSNNPVQVEGASKNYNEKGDKNQIEWIWREETPIPTYLTSVVIGTFSHAEDKYGKLPLFYYWPKDIENKNYEPMLTFKSTPSIIEYFQKYLDIKFPYSKYSQVAVDDFDFGGMENASCTTLTRNFLHDKKASIDYTGDIEVICHELAHQWFGDLVTCKDWSHIWLNEGFATYCEALFREHGRGLDDDEFLYYLRRISNRYFNEAISKYKRPLVTNAYSHPDEVFDDHSYRKGAFVLHMIRHYIGNEAFKKSLNAYLDKYGNKTAETDDLKQIFEVISGTNLQQFFNQWVYKPGHPELDLEYALEEEKDSKNLKIKIIQKQEQSNEFVFEFPLEVRIVFSDDNNDKKPVTIQISKKITDYLYEIPKYENIKWISINPEFKILKEIKSLKLTEEKDNFKLREMLLNQLKNAKTVIERIQAASILQDKKYSDDYVINALRDIILSNTFYGVCVVAANALGSYAISNDENIKSKVYQILIAFFRKDVEGNNQLYSTLRPQIRQALVAALGRFGKEGSLEVLKPLLSEQSYFVEQQAAIAIGSSSKNLPSDNQKKKEMIQLLEDLTNTTTTFQNLLARGAIDGLKEFSKDEDEQIVKEVADIIVNKSNYGNEYLLKTYSHFCFGEIFTQ